MLPGFNNGRVRRRARGQRQFTTGQSGAITAESTAFINRWQLRPDPGQINAFGLLHLLDEAQRLVREGQCLFRTALAQLAFGRPHLVQRGLQRGAGLRIEQGRRLGVVMGVAILGEHVGGAAEHRWRIGIGRLAAVVVAMRVVRACIGAMVVIVLVVMVVVVCGRRIAGGQVAGRRWLRRTFAFLAQELAVAQAQDALVDTDRIAALHEVLGGQAASLPDQRFGIDDDLPLAAEVRRQGLLDAALELCTERDFGAGQAQDHAAAAPGLRRGCMIVAHLQLGDHIVAGLRAQRRQIQGVGETPRGGFAAAGKRDAALHEGDVLTAALGGGDRQRCLRRDTVIVVGFEAQCPLSLPRRAQHQAGRGLQYAHAGCTVGHHIQPMQAGLCQCRFAHHAVQHRRACHILRLPLSFVLAQRQPATIVELQPCLVRCTVEAQRPGQSAVGGDLGVQRILGKRGLAGIDRCVDAQAGGLQA